MILSQRFNSLSRRQKAWKLTRLFNGFLWNDFEIDLSEYNFKSFIRTKICFWKLQNFYWKIDYKMATTEVHVSINSENLQQKHLLHEAYEEQAHNTWLLREISNRPGNFPFISIALNCLLRKLFNDLWNKRSNVRHVFCPAFDESLEVGR
jgi:hypothetical protein